MVGGRINKVQLPFEYASLKIVFPFVSKTSLKMLMYKYRLSNV